MILNNISRCRFATLLLLAILLCAAVRFSEHAGAQVIEEPSNMPSISSAARGMVALRRWVDALELPNTNDPSAGVELDGASGVCVILRKSGRVLGIGIDTSSDALMLRRAAGNAVNQALNDPTLASISAKVLKPQESDDSASQAPEKPGTVEGDLASASKVIEALRSDLGKQLAIEFEVAGKLTPLVGRTIRQMSRKIEPGLDGLAVRVGSTWQFAFPSQLRASNTGGDSEKALFNLIVSAGVPLKQLADPANPLPSDVIAYAFRAVHLIQCQPNSAVVQLTRGDVLVSDAQVDQSSIREFADGLVSWLIQASPPRLPLVNDTPRLGVRGDYRVVKDEHQPAVAAPTEQALSAFALLRYSKVAPRSELTEKSQLHALEVLLAIQSWVAGDPPSQPIQLDPAAVAITLLALSEVTDSRQLGALTELQRHAVDRAHACFDPEIGFRDPQHSSEASGPRAGISAHAQAMLACAMARRLALGKSEYPQQLVRSSIDAAWRAVAESSHSALLPWIAWAEFDFAASVKGPIANASDLKQIVLALDRARIGSVNAVGPADLIGGFAEYREPGSPVGASAHSALLAAWLPQAMKTSTVVSERERPVLLGRHLRTMRFLMQLTLREEHACLLRNPGQALGGMRESLWNSDQAVAAQAMGLITACETLSLFADRQ